jgi:hypothetical protein
MLPPRKKHGRTGLMLSEGSRKFARIFIEDCNEVTGINIFLINLNNFLKVVGGTVAPAPVSFTYEKSTKII